jgi:tRNA(Ile)-lysidine synthase
LRKSQKGKRIQFDGFEIFQDSNSFILNKIESENLLNVKWKVQKKEVENLPLEFNLHEIFLDQNTIKGDLVLRKWEIGDKMKPIGMKGSRLISDILKDAKLNQIEKKNILVLTDDEKVLWCVGLKISKEGIANSESKKIIKVWLENSEESNQKAKINS